MSSPDQVLPHLAEQDPSTAQFKIVVRDDLSLADLSEMVANGESVVRSPHVGSPLLYNLAVAATGAHLVVYDRTVPEQDHNYNPAYAIQAGEARQVVHKRGMRQLTALAHTTTAVGDMPAGSSVVDVHMSELRRAMPQARVSTMTEYLAAHRDVVTEVVTCLVQQGFDEEWVRRVDETGNVVKVDGSLQENVARFGIYGLGELGTSQQGLLWPNEFNVLLFAVLESLDHQGAETVTHVSGPDMVDYVQDMRWQLADMYRTLVAHASFGAQLPHQLQLQMVPASGARFVAPLDQGAAVDELWTALLGWHRVVRERREGWEPAAQAGKLAVEAAFGRYPEPLRPSRSRAYLTHNDVARAGGLYIPPDVWTMSFRQLSELLNELSRLMS